MSRSSEDIAVVVTSDIHAALAEDPKRETIGLPRLATFLYTLRKNHKAVFFLDAGDAFSGSVYGSFDHGRSLATILGSLGLTAICPGNHDFDYCQEESDPLFFFDTLLPLIRESGSPEALSLALNLSHTKKTVLPYHQREPLVLWQSDKGQPFRLIVLGVTTPYFSRPSLKKILKGFSFGLLPGPPENTSRNLLEQIKTALDPYRLPGDTVLLLSHLGSFNFAEGGNLTGIALAESQLASFVVDGHSHRLIPPKAFGRTLYCNCGDGLKSLALMRFPKDQSPSMELLGYDDIKKIHPNASIEAKIAEIFRNLELDKPICRIKEGLTLSYQENWADKTSLGHLVCQVMMSETGANLGLMNPGAFRDSSLAGQVSLGDIHRALPFADNLYSGIINGKKLKSFFRRVLLKGLERLPQFWGLGIFLYVHTVYPFSRGGKQYPRRNEAKLFSAFLIEGTEHRRIEEEDNYRIAFSGQMMRILGSFSPKPGHEGFIDHGPLVPAIARGLYGREIVPEHLPKRPIFVHPGITMDHFIRHLWPEKMPPHHHP
jgi:2',3'-cyclic-nucleotide 2'-phosphodiesterase (5'-nucleotidase family)